MKVKRPMTQLRVISMRCLVPDRGASFEWHRHPFEEFTFVADDETLIGFPPGKRPVKRNTLLLYRAGEPHGAWCLTTQAPRFWVVHFTMSDDWRRQLRKLDEPAPEDRLWPLNAEQAASFRWIFLQMLNERLNRRRESMLAEAAWLQLLLVSVQRWAEGESLVLSTPTGINPDAVKLWHLVNASVGRPEEFVKQIHLLRNYDSLRHTFRKAFGCSPRQMMGKLRIQQAKNMLLETSLSIKDVSRLLGYPRQHEFTRAFHQSVGLSPSAWRANPIRSSLTV